MREPHFSLRSAFSRQVVLYPVIVDQDKFDSVLATFKWDEERAEVKQKLGLA